jgi:2-C-methyl-D-erythritol 4-phosphate cytidylyltransferase
MSKTKWKLVTSYPVTEYKCGARAGDKVRLRNELPIRTHKGKLISTNPAGEIWTVLSGTKEKPPIIWLREPDGSRHTWDDSQDFLDWFEILRSANERIAVILLAAGRSTRMAGAVADKILAPLAGRPVFAHSVAAFAASGVADLYVIVHRDRRQMLALAAHAPTPAVFVRGGRERQDSVAAALAALPPDITHVFIHDCARPLVRPEQLRALLALARRHAAAVLAHRATDTIKQASANARRPARLRTVPRETLWAMETPQVFSRDLIARAYARVAAKKLRVTDDAQAVEPLRHPVALLENPHSNPKLTTPADFAWCEFLLRTHLAPTRSAPRPRRAAQTVRS